MIIHILQCCASHGMKKKHANFKQWDVAQTSKIILNWSVLDDDFYVMNMVKWLDKLGFVYRVSFHYVLIHFVERKGTKWIFILLIFNGK
jgi:hypothetical protein